MPTDDSPTALTDETESATTIVLLESVRDGILAHARAGAPAEVCGILAGVRRSGDGTTESRVETHHPAENVAETPRTRYAIDPREQLELMEQIEDAGREVVGFYHSHPSGPARPSATDAARATWPDRSYVIVSFGAGDGEAESDASVGAWHWTGEEFVAETVRVVESDES